MFDNRARPQFAPAWPRPGCARPRPCRRSGARDAALIRQSLVAIQPTARSRKHLNQTCPIANSDGFAGRFDQWLALFDDKECKNACWFGRAFVTCHAMQHMRGFVPGITLVIEDWLSR